MNAQAAQALYAAEAAGVKQIKGSLEYAGGLCALGVIHRACPIEAAVLLDTPDVEGCPLCGKFSLHQGNRIAHMNDHHDLTFAEIARKLGPDHA